MAEKRRPPALIVGGAPGSGLRGLPAQIPRGIADMLMGGPGPKEIKPGVFAQKAGGLIRDPNVGQSAGPPGLGTEPVLAHQPGGELLELVQHPAFDNVAYRYRALPEGSWFDPSVSPTRPIQFQLGAYQVPPGSQYWLFEYEFNAYRQSGIDPGDSIIAETGRFSTVLGFDINVDGSRQGDLLNQLDPVPVQLQRQEFQPFSGRTRRGDAGQFNTAAATSFAAAASPALSLLPPGRNTSSPSNGPYTIIAREGQIVVLSVVIWRPIPTPLSALEGIHRGYLIQTQVGDALVQRLRPR
jgi:hypothetical protein